MMPVNAKIKGGRLFPTITIPREQPGSHGYFHSYLGPEVMEKSPGTEVITWGLRSSQVR